MKNIMDEEFMKQHRKEMRRLNIISIIVSTLGIVVAILALSRVHS